MVLLAVGNLAPSCPAAFKALHLYWNLIGARLQAGAERKQLMGKKLSGIGVALLLILLLVLAVRFALTSLETAPAASQTANIEKVKREMKQIEAQKEAQLQQVDDAEERKANSESK